ncbi:coiled-coil domain-containing protein [Methylobacterium radiotolerans]|uniref:hypothetical protein n=1 Tax=Methylobacterium radiotolerans TaxID=31998 RepID=UPI0038CFFEE9
MIDGRELARRIDVRKDRLRRDERRLAAVADDAGRLLSKSRAEEASAWARLAGMRLAENDGVLSSRIDGSAREAATILERRDRRIDGTRAEIKALEGRAESLTSDLEHAVLVAADAAETAARRRSEALDALEKDEVCRAAAASVAVLQGRAAKAGEKTAAARAELDGKARPYLAEPMFAYLWERGYGTANYAGRGLVRLLDRWVAGLVGYDGARLDFHNLNEIPRRLASHTERLKADLAAAQASLDAASRIHTGPAEEAEAEAVRRKSEAEDLRMRLDRLRPELGRHGRELRMAAERNDADWLEAAAALGRSLAGDNLDMIEKAAALTPDPEDDALVAAIRAARSRIAEAERVSAAAAEELATVRKRRKGVEGEARFLASQGWDDDESLFEDELGSDALIQMAEGRLSPYSYRVKLNLRRKSKPRPVVRDEPSWSRDAGSVWGRGGSSDEETGSRRTSQSDEFRTGGTIGGSGGFVTGGVMGAVVGAALGGDGAQADAPSDFTTGGDF